MMRTGFAACGCFLVLTVVCATLASDRVASAQSERSGVTTALPGGGQQLARVALEGFVLAPDGSPAEGAVVVSSAGGKAVTDVAGNYRLEVEVALGATSVQVTAVGHAGRNLVARTSVSLDGRASASRLDPLQLTFGGSCTPSWMPTFGGRRETDDFISDWAVHDDGSGPALYAAGNFSTAGGAAASGIARWDGSSWSALAGGLNGWAHALVVFDDGGGPALYAAGNLTTADGVPANRIAKWDGSSWTALDSGIGGATAFVYDLAVFDDGGGPALYAAGRFTTAGAVSTSNIAKWDGAGWSALGSGVGGTDDVVLALAVFDDGNGPALYAAGRFTTAGGGFANRIARWDGSSWTALGSGICCSGGSRVNALVVYDDGGGPALYAAGDFTSAGGGAASRIAKWDGSSWSALDDGIANGFGGRVNSLTVFDDGVGPALYAGGRFASAGGVTANNLAKWDGTSWSALGSGLYGGSEEVYALAAYDDGDVPALYAGGEFNIAGGTPVSNSAKWNGSSWFALGSGVSDVVKALAVLDDGGGPALYAGGAFLHADDVEANRIAKWDGSSWTALGSGMNNTVIALAVHDDGSGVALYAGGSFTTAGGGAASRIAKWNGSSWTALGSGLNNSVNALAVHDDGSGAALYAGGTFTNAGGGAANRIARWKGSSWTALGSGLNDTVNALAVHDDGSGAALYAGGAFTTAGGVAANRIARWDGSSWSALGSGIDGTVISLATFDDGGGPALYAGGFFTSAGVPANRIAKWDGTSWSALGSGLNSYVLGLAVHDDGSGPGLFVGGNFTTAGGVAASFIARWNGSSWSAPGSGMNVLVQTLVTFDDGGGPALYAGGAFTNALDSGDSYLAKWGCPDSIPPVLSCPPPFMVPDLDLDGQEVVYFTVTATDGVDPAPVVVCVPPSGSTFPLGTTLVDCTATDDLGNQSTCQFSVTVAQKVRRR